MSLGLIATVCNALRNVYIPALTAEDFTCKSLIAGSANSVENPTNNITSLLTVENVGVQLRCHRCLHAHLRTVVHSSICPAILGQIDRPFNLDYFSW